MEELAVKHDSTENNIHGIPATFVKVKGFLFLLFSPLD